MKPILISLSPNTERDDIALTWKTMFNLRSWRDERILAEVKDKIAKRFDDRKVVLVSSGRAAIYRALQGFGVGPGDEVIIQAFTCLAVSAPVQWTGARPVYGDIDEETYNFDLEDLKRKITTKTKAIIVQHTFGIPGPIEEITEIGKSQGIKIIEDLAHGFGVVYKGKPLGSFGDAAIVSFGRDKTISCVFGGAIISANTHLLEKVQRRQEKLNYPPMWWVTQQLLHPIIMSVIIPLYFKGGIGRALLVLSQKVHFLSMAVTSNEKRGLKPPFLKWRMSPALGVLLEHQLDKLDRYNENRKKVAQQYCNKIKSGLPLRGVIEKEGWVRFPVRVKNRSDLLKVAKRQAIILGDWYSQPVTPSLTTKGHPTQYENGMCPTAEKCAKETINLPTHIRMTEGDIERVIAFINKSVK